MSCASFSKSALRKARASGDRPFWLTRYPILIQDGTVSHGGSAGPAVSGRVQANGAIKAASSATQPELMSLAGCRSARAQAPGERQVQSAAQGAGTLKSKDRTIHAFDLDAEGRRAKLKRSPVKAVSLAMDRCWRSARMEKPDAC